MMKKKIWKFELDTDETRIKMPANAEILTIQVQDEKPCIWALVDPLNSDEYRYFEIFGTGQLIHYDMGIDRKYINTFQLHNGSLVFHVFERIT